MENNKVLLPPSSSPPPPPDSYHSRRRPSARSEIRIGSPAFTIRLCIEGRLSKRQRRTILQTLYREIKPMLWYIGMEWFNHKDSSTLESMSNFRRPISFKQTPSFYTTNGNFGYMLRMRRLQMGLTQEQLAKAIGIDRTHLSKIEHGKANPRLVTFSKIESMLKNKVRDYFEAASVAKALRKVIDSTQTRSV